MGISSFKLSLIFPKSMGPLLSVNFLYFFNSDFFFYFYTTYKH